MKKVTILLLTIAMFLNISIMALATDLPSKEYPQRFYDVPKDHWAFSYIAELVDRGVISGYEDGSFKPTSTVSRAEFAKIMVGAAGVPTNNNNVYFTDMQNHWAIPYVNAAKNYLTAYADNTYRPNQAAVREDVTMAMVKLKGYDISNVDFSYLANFTDTDSISNNVKAYVAVAVEKGLISGFEDNTFRGQATLTRAEAATLLWRAFQYGSDNKVTDTSGTTATQVDASLAQTTTPTAPTATSAATTEVAIEPTASPTPDVTKKPYKVETLVKADFAAYTYDNNGTIYYADNKKIYSLTADGINEEVFDCSTMNQYDDFGNVMSGFSIYDNICCDTEGNIYFKTGSLSHGRNKSMCKVINGSAELFHDIKEVYDDYPLILISGDSCLFNAYDGGRWSALLWSSSGDDYGRSFVDICEYDIDCAAEYNGNIIISNDIGIYEYDYNTTIKIADKDYATTVGLSNNGYVIEKDGKFIIRSYDGDTEIKFSIDDCEIKDKASFSSSYGNRILFLMPDNSVAFYDKTNRAFRLISKN